MGSEYVGKSLLVGITFLNPDGSVHHHQQEHGVIEALDAEAVSVRLKDGHTMRLPAGTAAFEPAPKGQYTLQSTGEVVVDPDYLTTLTVVPRS